MRIFSATIIISCFLCCYCKPKPDTPMGVGHEGEQGKQDKRPPLCDKTPLPGKTTTLIPENKDFADVGSKVPFEQMAALRTGTYAAHWGTALTDIENHYPEQSPYIGAPYRVGQDDAGDLSVKGHEDTHMINYFLSNKDKDQKKSQGLYIRDNKFVKFIVPTNTSIACAAGNIPEGFRKMVRYNTYISGKIAANSKSPSLELYSILYLFNEWTAYLNGAEVAYQVFNNGKIGTFNFDAVAGTLDFIVFGTAAVKSIRDFNPEYMQNNKDFIEFYGWMLKESIEMYKKISPIKQLAVDADSKYLQIKGSKEINQIISSFFGESFTKTLFAFNPPSG